MSHGQVMALWPWGAKHGKDEALATDDINSGDDEHAVVSVTAVRSSEWC